MPTILAAVLAVTTIPASADEPTRYLDPMFESVTKTADIVYGEAMNSEGELQQLKLDLYAPTGDTERSRPLYVWSHGGGWTSGDKSEVGPIIEYTKSGWVTVSLDYRMRPNLPGNFDDYITNPGGVPEGFEAMRDAAHDTQAAVRFVRKNAETFGIDPDKIAVGGYSAGAINSLNTVFNEDDPGDSGTPDVSSHVAAGVSHAGSYIPVVQGTGILPGKPPIAIFHSLDDIGVPAATSILPCLLTRAMLNVCEFGIYSDLGHEVFATREAQDFLYRYVVQA